MRERLANEARTGPWEQVMLGFLRKVDKPLTTKSSHRNFQSDPKLGDPVIHLINVIFSVNDLSRKLIRFQNSIIVWIKTIFRRNLTISIEMNFTK